MMRMLAALALVAALAGCADRNLDPQAAVYYDRALGPVQGRDFADCQQRESNKLDHCVKYAEDLGGCYSIYQTRYLQCQEKYSR